LVVNMSLDRELQSDYKFTITANDSLHSTSTDLTLIVLDVNDHNARFSQSVYSVNISETTPSETILLKLDAFDSDEGENGRLHYSIINVDGIKIVESDKSSIPFRLDSRTGELRLVTTPTHSLDYEIKKVYKLTISATDGGIGSIPALATVYVNVVNENDNLPVITLTFGSNQADHNLSEVYINENQPNSTFIAYVSINYRDQTVINNHLKWDVVSSDLNSKHSSGFFIQKLTSATFTLLTDHSYDRENQTYYSVIIRAKDELNIVEKHFQIIVNDLNDNPPMFNSSIFDIDLDKYRLSISKLVFTLRAIDADIGENGRVSYMRKSLSWPYWINLFDNNTGIAYLTINCSQMGNDSLSFDDGWFHLSNGEIWLEIEAYDHGESRLSSTTKIRLYRSSVVAQLDKTNEQLDGTVRSILHQRSSQLLNWFKNDYVIIAFAVILAILLLSIIFFVCCCIRIKRSRHNNNGGTMNKNDRWKKKSTSLITTIVRDDNNHNKKIIQSSSSSSSNNDEHSSFGSLCSEKSDNVTVETAASCNMDLFLFSPSQKSSNIEKSTIREQYNESSSSTNGNVTNYQFCFVNTLPASNIYQPTDNKNILDHHSSPPSTLFSESLSNRLFNSIQQDLSLLTENFRSSSSLSKEMGKHNNNNIHNQELETVRDEIDCLFVKRGTYV
ncbi:unnamed protein product, partial [Didymodactylos carnosus]